MKTEQYSNCIMNYKDENQNLYFSVLFSLYSSSLLRFCSFRSKLIPSFEFYAYRYTSLSVRHSNSYSVVTYLVQHRKENTIKCVDGSR